MSTRTSCAKCCSSWATRRRSKRCAPPQRTIRGVQGVPSLEPRMADLSGSNALGSLTAGGGHDCLRGRRRRRRDRL
eukprot:3166566-Prymnesium_polylepis.2